MFLSHHFSSVARLRAGLGSGGGLPTPIAAYNFNGDGSDEVGSNTATINGATLTKGWVGYAYDFDGSNDYATTGAWGTSQKSFSFIINGDVIASKGLIYQGSGVQIYIDGSSRLTCSPASGQFLIDNTGLSTGTNYHCVIVINGANSKIYINGSERTLNTNSVSVTSTGHASNSMYIGATTTPSLYFNGRITNVYPFSEHLSASQVTEMYNSGNPKIYTSTNGWIDETSLEYGALAYWKLESSSLTESVAGFDLTETGTPTYTTGILNNALNLDGTSDAASVTTDLFNFDDNADKFSISLWYYTTDANRADFEGILSTETAAAGGGWRIFHDSGNATYKFRYALSVGATDVNFGTLSDSTWHHLVVVKDGGNIQTYLDGSAANTGTTASSKAAAGVLAFGAYRAGDLTNFLAQGLIDEVFITQNTLTSTQVTALYASGSPGTGQQYPF